MNPQEKRTTVVVKFDKDIHIVRYNGQDLYKYTFDTCPMCKTFKMKHTEYPDGTGYDVCYNCMHMTRW